MENEMYTEKSPEISKPYPDRSKSRSWAGIFLLIVGAGLLLNKLDILLFPSWVFSWPVLLIAIGLFSLLRHGVRSGFPFILILIGVLNLADQLDSSLHMEKFIAPVVLIAIGIGFLLNRNKKFGGGRRWRKRFGHEDLYTTDSNTGTAGFSDSGDRRDFIDVTSIFGGVKKNILTKSFKGGDITSFMGGSEINMTQADFSGRIKIDATNIFGGTKLIVPPNWDVQSDVVTIFGGVDDKRQVGSVPVDRDKLLILDGVCLFGGIEIRSY